MKKLGDAPHWKEMASLVLFGAAAIILLFYFPKATTWGITIVGYTALAMMIFGSMEIYRRLKHSQKLEAEDEGKPDHSEKQAKPHKRPDSASYPQNHRFYFELSIFAISFFCWLIHSFLRNSGRLSLQHESLLLAIACLAGSMFCTLNLFWGIREKRTWCRGFSNIVRSESPCNYWVAISLWVFFTIGFLAGLISKTIELVSG